MNPPQDTQQPAVAPQTGIAQPATSPSRKFTSAAVRADLVAQIRGLAESVGAVPDICKRRAPGEPDPTVGTQVPDWHDLRRRKEFDLLQAYPAPTLHPSTFVPTSQVPPPPLPDVSAAAAAAVAAVAAAALPVPVPVPPMVPAPTPNLPPLVPAMPAPAAVPAPAPAQSERQSGGVRHVGKVTKANKSKGGGRTFTSKYRGVHQTFPTRRWEAQFRRNGKPTSLGCFDQEEQAARAYDKMMLWCELHNATGVKGGITNFDAESYGNDVEMLKSITQDDLVQMLRSEGRRQAAQRMLKQKREGAAQYQRDQSGSDDE